MDRNLVFLAVLVKIFLVAPREGSVDRNGNLMQNANSWLVAPREGSVDRNHYMKKGYMHFTRSLPARGAWIEISARCSSSSFRSSRSPRGERG